MVRRALLLIVVAIVSYCTDAAVCTFENRPNQTDQRYSAVVKGKRVYGSPIQENEIFFEHEPGLYLSFACFIGLYWAVCSASVTILLTKTVPQFGWTLNRPNLCGGLVAIGSFLMGADYVQELCQRFLVFENDLDYYKWDKVDILDDLGWICYFWALDIFTVLWINIAKATGCGRWSRTIRYTVGFLSITGTAIFSVMIVLSLGLLIEDTVNSDLSAVDIDDRRIEAMPKWHLDANKIIWPITTSWALVALIINTLSAVLMSMSVSQKDFDAGSTFSKITQINFYQQMLFNACLGGFIACNFVYVASDDENRTIMIPALWCVIVMALSWGGEFVVIFAYTVDQRKDKSSAVPDPLKMFGDNLAITSDVDVSLEPRVLGDVKEEI